MFMKDTGLCTYRVNYLRNTCNIILTYAYCSCAGAHNINSRTLRKGVQASPVSAYYIYIRNPPGISYILKGHITVTQRFV